MFFRIAFVIAVVSGKVGEVSAAPGADRAAGAGASSPAWAAAVCADGETVRGIDVSHHQSTIDWPAVADSGVQFAFIRVSDGLNYPDTKFAANWPAAREQGILRGAYQYFRPSQDPVAQAQLFLDAVGSLLPRDLPPVLDIEITSGKTPAEIAERALIWLNMVEQALGVRPIIYTAAYFWNESVGNVPELAQYPLWVAHWGVTCPNLPTLWQDWLFHQDSATGDVPGIAGDVDMNVFNGTRSQLLTYAVPTVDCSDGICVEVPEQGETAPGICGAIAPTGGVIDDQDACFFTGGDAEFIRWEGDTGYNNSLAWTYATHFAATESYAQWQLYFEEAGRYRVSVYTPAPFAQAQLARYEIQHGHLTTFAPVDQSAVDGWQIVGDLDFSAGGGQWVLLADNTGDLYSLQKQLVFDAVQLERLDLPEQPDPGCSTGSGGIGGLLIAVAALCLHRRRSRAKMRHV